MTDYTNRIGIDMRKYKTQPQKVTKRKKPVPTKRKRKEDPSFYKQVVEFAKSII
ncbi:hypothetical protein N9Y31_03365 [Alphaproteobacteria bacterium]|nr:hypothetical protein [Alphaproteobacteria bacterium]